MKNVPEKKEIVNKSSLNHLLTTWETVHMHEPVSMHRFLVHMYVASCY